MSEEFKIIDTQEAFDSAIKSRLERNTKTVTEISTELNIGGGSVYTLINELVDIDVIACVDEEQKRNKRYAATPLGVDIITSIDGRNLE